MLFKKYASPFDFLDGISEMGMFEQGILNLIEDEKERNLWELYLHSHGGKSFNEWKEAVEGKQDQVKEMTDEEINTAVEKAKRALNLQQKGG